MEQGVQCSIHASSGLVALSTVVFFLYGFLFILFLFSACLCLPVSAYRLHVPVLVVTRGLHLDQFRLAERRVTLRTAWGGTYVASNKRGLGGKNSCAARAICRNHHNCASPSSSGVYSVVHVLTFGRWLIRRRIMAASVTAEYHLDRHLAALPQRQRHRHNDNRCRQRRDVGTRTGRERT
jgi:hypothetical protein